MRKITIGGKGVNGARVLHTIGVPVHVTGLAGESMLAFMTEGLAQERINPTFLPIAGPARTCTAIVELDRQRVTEINEPGPTIMDTEAQAFRDSMRPCSRRPGPLCSPVHYRQDYLMATMPCS